MKKTILAMAVMLVTGLTSAFANKSNDVNKLAVASFYRDFATAKNVIWEQQKDFVKVTFTMNDQTLYAYYNNADGQMVAVTRNILSDQLPIGLLTSFKNNFNGYWVSDLFEMSSDGQTAYYATLESGNETLVLKSNGFNEWTVYQKEKKK
jgi:hypothetical protein